MTLRVVTFDGGETLLRPFPSFGHIVVECCRKAGESLADERSLALEHYADSYFVAMRLRGETFSRSLQRSHLVWTDIYHGFLVGDSLTSDVLAARNVGLETVLLDRNRRHLNPPVRRIPALTELLLFPDLTSAK